MRTSVLTVCTLLGLILGGCQLDRIPKLIRGEPLDSQPYMTQARLDRGLVIVLTGIEGRSNLNEDIVNGLAKGNVNYAIKLEDWTTSWIALVNQETKERNMRKARAIATTIVNYRWAYPDRPVILVGQSGGAAMAVWITESLKGESVDGIILLAASLSHQYRLDQALANSERGIVNFYSGRDVVLLGFGTKVFRTMDGANSSCAGMLGFDVPARMPPAYRKLYQIPWNSKMGEAGNHGLHLTSGSEAYVAEFVAPFVLNYQWNERLVAKVSKQTSPAPVPAPTGVGLSSR